MPSDYNALLKRAKEKIPEAISTGERFQVPDLDVNQEGKATIVRNFGEVLDTLNRPADHLLPILLRELGAAGTLNDGRLTLQGRHPARNIMERLNKYVEMYVICSECGRPDTHLVKQERTLVLKCDACGGHRPVRVRKADREEKEPEAVEVDKVYEVKIEDMGRQGDGIARRDKYTIFVKGAAKGQIVNVKVTNISGTLAFGEVVRE